MPRYVLGIDAGTESIRSVIYDDQGHCVSVGVSENKTVFPRTGWCEQGVEQWERSIVGSIRDALANAPISPDQVEGVGVDATTCTVIHLDENRRPLRNAIMWMDLRAAKEAEEISRTGDPALKYVGYDRISAEWFPCKNLWVKRNQPDIYRKASTIFEHTDWVAFWLTGQITASINTVTVRWLYNVKEGGFPTSLYKAIDLDDIFDKLPQRIVRIGEVVGGITKEVSELTGLQAGIPVAGGAADASIGVIGVNALRPGKLALVTGSSQLHLGLTDVELHAPGIFGTYPSGLIPEAEMIEAGQTSTGSVLNWFMSDFLSAELKREAEQRGISAYELMNEKAAEIPPGSEGVLVLEHWQGNRSPWVDATSRGVIRGLTLRHTPAHIYRAIMEGVAYGTAVILRVMKDGGVVFDEIIACGGATNSPLWMQIMADVTGKPITIPEEQQAVSLGSAIAATVAADIYASLEEAAGVMVRTATTVEPELKNARMYSELVNQYSLTYEALKDVSSRLVNYVSAQQHG